MALRCVTLRIAKKKHTQHSQMKYIEIASTYIRHINGRTKSIGSLMQNDHEYIDHRVARYTYSN